MVCARRVGRTSVSRGVQCSCRLVVISVSRCGCACVDVGEWVSQVVCWARDCRCVRLCVTEAALRKWWM